MDVRMSGRDLSLDASVGEDGDSTHMDYLAYGGEDQETALIRKEEMALVQHNIAGALAGLNEKESFIIRNRVMAESPNPSGDRRPLSHHTGAPGRSRNRPSGKWPWRSPIWGRKPS